MMIASAAVLTVAAAVIVFAFLNPKIKAAATIELKEISSAKDITLIWYRGLSSQAPENTLAAFELAAKKGLESVEFDVQLTKDGVWAVSHDATLNRMTDGKGSISDYTFFDIVDFYNALKFGNNLLSPILIFFYILDNKNIWLIHF